MITVAVVTQKTKTKKQVSRALSSGGLSVCFVEDTVHLPSLRKQQKIELIIVDVDVDGPEEIARVLELIDAGGEHTPVVLLSLETDKHALIELFQKRDVINLVAKHGAVRAVRPALDERELLVTCQKVLRKDIFGINKYIGAWGTEYYHHTVTKMEEKQSTLDALEAYLRTLGCPENMVPEIVNVADEFLLNAIVHAPVGPDGAPKYRHLGPRARIELLPNEYVSLAYGCDGQRFMLSVTDNFGRLDPATLSRFVVKGLGDEKLTPGNDVHGAGIGLTLAFRGVHQFVINVQSQTRTECMAGWQLVESGRAFKEIGKSFNLFCLPKDAGDVGSLI